MTQTSNRMFDELARLMTEAANVAQGVGREASTAVRSQAERWIADLDLVRRDEFDAVKEMVSKARAENDKLAARIADLEAQLAAAAKKPATTAKAAEKKSASAKTTGRTRRTTRKSPSSET